MAHNERIVVRLEPRAGNLSAGPGQSLSLADVTRGNRGVETSQGRGQGGNLAGLNQLIFTGKPVNTTDIGPGTVNTDLINQGINNLPTSQPTLSPVDTSQIPEKRPDSNVAGSSPGTFSKKGITIGGSTMSWPLAISLLGSSALSLISGSKAADAAKSAAEGQAAATERAAEIQRESTKDIIAANERALEQARTDLSPFRDAGLSQLGIPTERFPQANLSVPSVQPGTQTQLNPQPTFQPEQTETGGTQTGGQPQGAQTQETITINGVEMDRFVPDPSTGEMIDLAQFSEALTNARVQQNILGLPTVLGGNA